MGSLGCLEVGEKMKNKSLVWFGIIGGAIGFLIHYFWHLEMNIRLFSIAPHIFLGFIYTFIGILVGVILWFIWEKILKGKS